MEDLPLLSLGAGSTFVKCFGAVTDISACVAAGADNRELRGVDGGV